MTETAAFVVAGPFALFTIPLLFMVADPPQRTVVAAIRAFLPAIREVMPAMSV